MKIITSKKINTTTVETFNRPRVSRTEQDEQVENITTEIEVDSYDERDSLEMFLKKEGFKQSDGFFGKQRDFNVGSHSNKGVTRLLITLQSQGEKHEKMIQAVKNWFNTK